VAQTARRLNVTHRAAQLNVDKLVEAGVLELLPGRTRNRVYMARGVLAVVELDVGKVSLSQPETPDPRT
jgi:hypothetical protein